MKMRQTLRFFLIFVVVSIVVGIIRLVFLANGMLHDKPKLSVLPTGTNNVLRVATDKDYWPYSFMDEKGGLSGREIELATLVANELGRKLEISALSWEECIDAAAAHKVDLVMTCTDVSVGREMDALDMSLAIESDRFVVFGRQKIDSLENLKGHRIGLMLDGNINSVLFAAGFKPFIHQYSNYREVLAAIQRNEVDYTVVRYNPMVGWLKECAISDIKPQLVLGSSYFCIGVDKRQPELFRQVNCALALLRLRGTINQLNDKWLTTYVEPMSLTEIAARNKGLFVVLLTLMLLLVILIGTLAYGYYRTKYLRLAIKRYHAKRRLAQIADRSRSELFLNMSHNISASLNSIMDFTFLALEAMDKGKAKEETTHNLLMKIQTSGESLFSLLNNALDISRLDFGRARTNAQAGDVVNVFRNIRGQMENLAKENGVDLHFETEDITEHQVFADFEKCSHILLNVITNAIKYNKPGGRVIARCEQVEKVKNGIGVYRFTVRDTGVGMSEDFQRRLYERYAREQSGSNGGSNGLGLGLPVCKGFIDLMRGSIEFRSKQGDGTTFIISIPLRVIRNKNHD